MVLLDILTSPREYHLNLLLAHLNHLLRGEESDRDEEFVREAAGRYGLPCLVERVAVRELARTERRSLEDAGREARQRFLERVLRKEGGTVVALAHHADDQAETVLMRLLRGSGTTGLSGMSYRAGWKVRPLLDATRQEIVAYADSRNIAFREDRSNDDRSFLRNRIRHELLPLLAAYNPHISRTLGTTAAIVAADDEALTSRAEERFALLATIAEGEVLLPVTELTHEPDAMRFRIYRRAIREINGDARAISYRHLRDVDGLLRRNSPSCSVTLPRSLRVGRVYASLRFSRDETAAAGDDIRIDSFGRFLMFGGELLVAPVAPLIHYASLTASHALIDPESAPFPWRVRSFREGDRMVPFGMTGRGKLKDIFINLKIPRHRRRELPILCDGDGNILAVLGIRRSNVATLTDATRRAVMVTFSGSS